MRTHYVQVADRITGTQRFTRTVTGTTHLVGQPGAGLASKEGGQTVRYDQTGSGWQDLTGHHDFADTMLTRPTPCAAIA